MAERILLTTDEIWKSIPLADGYEVSSLGQVRSWVSTRQRRLEHPHLVALNWTRNRSYRAVRFQINGKRKKYTLHQLVATLFVENISPLITNQVNHKDGNKNNNASSNLEWVTSKENHDHAVRTGLKKTWADYIRKLEPEQVRMIRASTESQEIIARRFGIRQATVSRIRRKESYADI